MRVAFLIALLVAVASAQVSNGQISWNGEWGNNCLDVCFGGNLYTCAEGNQLFGTYSDIGHVVGTINGRTVTGSWREAGYTDFVTGGFKWTLAADGGSFEGEFWFDDNECVKFPWTGERSEDDFDRALCAIVADTDKTLEGHWQFGTPEFGLDNLYLCLDDDDHQNYVLSFDIDPPGIQGYDVGRVYENNRIGQGSYLIQTTTGVTEGISLSILTGEDELTLIFYEVESYNDAIGNYYDPSSVHGRTVFTRQSTTSQQSCSANSDLLGIKWTGSWTDLEFGEGRFYTCKATNGNSLWGVYSEYGFVQGTVNGNRAIGDWYDSGAGTGTRGTFDITMSADGHEFDGYWATIEEPDAHVQWRENRVDITGNLDQNCQTLEGGRFTIGGEWSNSPEPSDRTWICLNDDGTFQASYEYSGLVGYMEGFYWTQRQSLQYNWFEPGSSGIGIARLTSHDRLVDSWWTDPVPTDPFNRCATSSKTNSAFFDLHSVDHYNRVSDTTSSRNCLQYECAKTDDCDLDVPPPPSSAQQLVLSFGCLIAVLLLWI